MLLLPPMSCLPEFYITGQIEHHVPATTNLILSHVSPHSVTTNRSSFPHTSRGSTTYVPLLSSLVAVGAAVEAAQVATDDAAVLRERNAVAAGLTQQRVCLDDEQLTGTRLHQPAYWHCLPSTLRIYMLHPYNNFVSYETEFVKHRLRQY